jgi:pseudouridine-5'-phosphate glycosidase
LDLGLTLEYLETEDVPAIGYETEVLPAFFTRSSEFKLNASTDSIAETLKAK